MKIKFKISTHTNLYIQLHENIWNRKKIYNMNQQVISKNTFSFDNRNLNKRWLFKCTVNL